MKYLIRMWLETLLFWGMRGLALPAWLRYSMAQTTSEKLDYDTLLALNARYPRAAKTPGDAEIGQQKKWAGRVLQVVEFFKAEQVLEIGCGYGFASLYMAQAGKNVSATDVVDVRYPEVKASGVQFALGDVCARLPYEDNRFDLVYSINSFEHFPDPDKALSEILRVTRPGGIVFLAFGPLYYSAWGLHASRRLGMPYPQLLFSEETIQRFVDEKQAEIAHTYDQSSDKSKIGPYLNKYSLQQYRQIFRKHRDHLREWVYSETIILNGRGILWQYPGILKKDAPSFEDLLVGGIKYIAQKKRGYWGTAAAASQQNQGNPQK